MIFKFEESETSNTPPSLSLITEFFMKSDESLAISNILGDSPHSPVILQLIIWFIWAIELSSISKGPNSEASLQSNVSSKLTDYGVFETNSLLDIFCIH